MTSPAIALIRRVVDAYNIPSHQVLTETSIKLQTTALSDLLDYITTVETALEAAYDVMARRPA